MHFLHVRVQTPTLRISHTAEFASEWSLVGVSYEVSFENTRLFKFSRAEWAGFVLHNMRTVDVIHK